MRIVIEHLATGEDAEVIDTKQAGIYRTVYIDLGKGRKLRIGETIGGDLALHTVNCGLLIEPQASNSFIIKTRDYEEVEYLDARAEGRT